MTRHKQYTMYNSAKTRFAAVERGNLGKAYELFGDQLETIITDMNRVLTA